MWAYIDVYFKPDVAPYLPSTTRILYYDCDKTLNNPVFADPILTLTH